MFRPNGVSKKAACTALVVIAGVMVATLVMSASTARSDELVMIEKAMYGPYGRPTFLVANSEAAWNQMMSDLAADGGLVVVPGPEAPQVDWNLYCVVLIAAGATGYDVGLQLIPIGNGNVALEPVYVQIPGQDGGESLPYYLGRTEKHSWLKTQLQLDGAVASTLPLSGHDTSSPTIVSSWGAIKASHLR
jgi:hypothetical protein